MLYFDEVSGFGDGKSKILAEQKNCHMRKTKSAWDFFTGFIVVAARG